MSKESRRKKIQRTPTKTMNGHNPNAPAHVGHDVRLAAYKELAVQLKMKGYSLHQIVAAIVAKFDLQEPMTIQAVSLWLRRYERKVNEENEAVTRCFIEQEHERLDAIVQFNLEIALKKDLYVCETQEDGSIVKKSAFAQQAKAAEIAIKAIGAICKLRGLNLEKGSEEEKGDITTFQSLQMLILNTRQQMAREGETRPIFKSDVLSLENDPEDGLDVE